ncbi:L,D-transpeptidase family protein [Nocardioides pacificus]
MPRLLARVAAVAALALAPLAVPAATPAAAPGPGPGGSMTTRLDGVPVRMGPKTRQVLTVNPTRGHHARVTWWVRTDSGWRAEMRTRDGRIGYGGLVPGHRRRQGTGTTPLGTYALPSAFGMHAPRKTWDLPYRRVRQGDYWVQDNASRFYNRYRNKRQGGFRWRLPASDPNSSERLLDYRRQYEWAVVTGFNRKQVRHRGSGIFLHVNGSGATAGCVSVPRPFMRALMRRIEATPTARIAIGR